MKARCIHLAVERTARYYELGDRDADDVWLVLHGYGQLAAAFVHEFESLADRRRILAPEGLSRFYGPRGRDVGASWMTREDRLEEIRDYVEYLDAVVTQAGVSRSAVTVLGFSQGGHTACRWAAAQPAVRRLILWGSTVPEDLETTCFGRALRNAEMSLVAGRDDRFVRKSDLERDVGRLRELGVHASLVLFEGGHEIRADVLAEIASQSSGGAAGSSVSLS